MDEPELTAAAEHSRRYLAGRSERPVRAAATQEELRAAFDVPLTEEGIEPRRVIDDLAAAAEPGLIASTSPRFYGYVIGGAQDVAIAADWLTSVWDQNAGGYAASPAAAMAEEVACRWILDLLELPSRAGVGLVTGCQMAHFTTLAAARRAVLLERGWDVDLHGLQGAPEVRVIVGEYVHVTARVALRMLGLGYERPRVITADDQGRMRADELRAALAESDAPTIVCAQAGEIHTGAFDPLPEIIAAAHDHGAWCHVDGAFGLWAAASPRFAPLVEGVAGADSWATDAHKWLNTPYDCGIAIVADAAVHRAAMTSLSPYVPPPQDGERWGFEWAPEFSRRARGFAVYAVLRALGRRGIADLVERCCDRAREMAGLLAAADEVEVVHDVVLNQLSVRFGDDDELTERITAAVQAEGTCFPTPSTFRDRTVMRMSFSNWLTTSADVERSAEAILAVARRGG